MKKDRNEVNAYLEQVFARKVYDKKTQAEVMTKAFTKYGMPHFRTQSVLKSEVAIPELDDMEIFWLLDCLEDKKEKISEWFTDAEIAAFSGARYRSAKVDFPLVIPALKVNDTQWISVVQARDLVAWRSQFIRYNKEIQRRLAIRVRDGLAYSVISLKDRSVLQMVDMFKKGEFVPNTITLNITDDDEFYYDEATSCLVFSSIKYLDLTDGYHRLVALTKCVNANPSFDYPMELRFTYFSEEQAGQFIYQEEQRTPIPKDSVDAHNMNDIANRITKRINDSSCNLRGQITNGGILDVSIFSWVLNECLVSKMTEDECRKATPKIIKNFVDGINYLTECFPDILDDNKVLTKMEARIFVFCLCKYYGKEKDEGLRNLYERLRDYPYNEKDRQRLSVREKYAVKVLERVSGDV